MRKSFQHSPKVTGYRICLNLGKAPHSSILYLNRNHGEEIEVELVEVIPEKIWETGDKGVYAVMEHAIGMFGNRYEKNPRVLAVGPAAGYTDFGAIVSALVKKGKRSM